MKASRLAISAAAIVPLAEIARGSLRAFVAAGNSTQVPGGPSSVNLDLTTAAVVSFILLLLGLAAAILLLGRLVNPRAKS